MHTRWGPARPGPGPFVHEPAERAQIIEACAAARPARARQTHSCWRFVSARHRARTRIRRMLECVEDGD